MKKLFSILILVLYSITTCGYIIEIHYCADEISEIKLITTSNEKPNCGCDEEMENDFCCKSEYKSFKISFDQKVILSTKNNFGLKGIFSNTIVSNYNFSKENSFDEIFQFHPPNKNSIQSINSIFLI